MLDDSDRRLLRQYQHAPDLGPAELAERAGLAPATCARRLERLRAAGIIRGNRAVIDWRALGYEVEVSLRITLDKTQARAFDEFLDRRPERSPRSWKSRPFWAASICACR